LHHPKKEKTLSNNTVRCIYQDKEGDMWVGTDFGLNKLLPDGTFQRIPIANKNQKGLAHHVVKAVYQDKENVLWIGTLSGLTAMTKINCEYTYVSYFTQDNNASSISGDNISS